jgi:hypothetical protein
MKRFASMVVAGVLGLMLVGCASTGSTASVPQGEMYEVKSEKNGRIYVLGSSPSYVNFVKAKREPGTTLTKVGFGPNGETVVFEADKEGMENRLVAQYSAKYKK